MNAWELSCLLLHLTRHVVGRVLGFADEDPVLANTSLGFITRLPHRPARSCLLQGITVELVDEAKEWFSQETLREVVPPGAVVVHGVAALHEGVLQKFVQPRGQHYFSLRATWSPNVSVDREGGTALQPC